VDFVEGVLFHDDLVPKNDRQLACQVTSLPSVDAHVLLLSVLGHIHNHHTGNTILLHMQGRQLKRKKVFFTYVHLINSDNVTKERQIVESHNFHCKMKNTVLDLRF
jgi:hypothetical protein